MPRKYKIEDVEKIIESIGYKLINLEKYENLNTKFTVECDKGHVYDVSLRSINGGSRCKRCACKKAASKRIASYKDVKKHIESFGYKLLSTEYINGDQPLEVICDKGHEWITNFTQFKLGTRCKQCGYINAGNSKKLNYDYVREYVESQSYKLMSKEYVRSGELLEMRCPQNHICFISWDNFKYGRRCRTCKDIETGNRSKHDFKYVKNYIESFGCKLLENEYINQNAYMKIMCSEGHVFERHLSSFKVTQRCPICGMSKGEEKVKDFLENNSIEYVYDKPYFDDLLSYRGNPLRPDFILPETKTWIEFDGKFHYEKLYESDGHEDLLIHDKIKDEYAKLNGWKLIRIPYWEIDNIENILINEFNK